MTTTSKNRPTHSVALKSGEGDSARFIEIGAVFTAKSGKASTIQIPDGLTICGGALLVLQRIDWEARDAKRADTAEASF